MRIAYDADDSGELAAKRDTQKLQAIGVECFRIRFPLGEDANSYALAAGADALKKAVRSAAWLGSGVAPAPSSSLAAELVAKEEAAKTPKDGGVLDNRAERDRRIKGSPEGQDEVVVKGAAEARRVNPADRKSVV